MALMFSFLAALKVKVKDSLKHEGEQYMSIAWHHYRPQTKFAKVIFSHVSVCPWGGGVCPIACWDTHLPETSAPTDHCSPGADTPPGAHPPGADTPLGPEADTPQDQTPPVSDTPGTRQPPGADIPLEQTPPRADTHLQCMLADTANKQAVYILLEYILVGYCVNHL